MSGLGVLAATTMSLLSYYVHLIIVYAMRLIMLTLDHVINGLFMLP